MMIGGLVLLCLTPCCIYANEGEYVKGLKRIEFGETAKRVRARTPGLRDAAWPR